MFEDTNEIIKSHKSKNDTMVERKMNKRICKTLYKKLKSNTNLTEKLWVN
jgi:hypothetical protein